MTHIYLVVENQWHDTTIILGAFDSLEKAKAHPIPAEHGAYDQTLKQSLPYDPDKFSWKDEGWYVENRPTTISESRYPGWDNGSYLIYRLEVQ